VTRAPSILNDEKAGRPPTRVHIIIAHIKMASPEPRHSPSQPSLINNGALGTMTTDTYRRATPFPGASHRVPRQGLASDTFRSPLSLLSLLYLRSSSSSPPSLPTPPPPPPPPPKPLPSPARPPRPLAISARVTSSTTRLALRCRQPLSIALSGVRGSFATAAPNVRTRTSHPLSTPGGIDFHQPFGTSGFGAHSANPIAAAPLLLLCSTDAGSAAGLDGG
jgi:hypothetical protein